jgi:hypothetical protein
VRRGRLVACVCLLGVFTAALVTSLDYSLIDALGPGPGFFPFWLSLLGAALTVAILVETVRSHDIATGSILPSWQAARPRDRDHVVGKCQRPNLKVFKMKLSMITVAVVALAMPASAAEIVAEGDTISITGQIEQDDYAHFRDALTAKPQTRVVILNSPGGRLTPAITIGREIRARKTPMARFAPARAP